jgi:chemotaxis methyl-accepting protein methylase
MNVQTGHDFSKYKRNTVLRRLARRMQLTHSARIADYLAHLRETPEEARRLFNDLLITVTTFFRDPEAWSTLAQKIIAPLVERTGANEQLRVWVPGSGFAGNHPDARDQEFDRHLLKPATIARVSELLSSLDAQRTSIS